MAVSLSGRACVFFVSGFLIYAAYGNSRLANYIRNRFLRLIPALVVVTLGGMAVTLVAHGWRDLVVHPGLYTSWVLCADCPGASLLCYCGIILYLVFEARPIPLSFDISYGTYMWHMPIFNLLLVRGFPVCHWPLP